MIASAPAAPEPSIPVVREARARGRKPQSTQDQTGLDPRQVESGHGAPTAAQTQRGLDLRLAAASGLVVGVAAGSLAESAGFRVGDRILAIDGSPLEDLIDYRFACCEPRIVVRCLRGSQTIEITVSKHPDEDLGLAFEKAVFDRIRHCANRCEFCFIHQMPGPASSSRRLRETLYVQDDDYRLSFLQGNFVTLTNLSERDWRRIARLHLSPLYVSIHTLDGGLRSVLLRQPLARNIVSQLDRLVASRVQFHGQIVLVPGRNDGEQLDRTITESVDRWWPHLLTLCVVPYGATRFRSDNQLADLSTPSPRWCASVIKQVKQHQRHFRKALGDPVVRLADEFYLQAGERFPGARHYGGFPNLADGVGGVSLLWTQWRKIAHKLPQRLSVPQRVYVATGMAGKPVIAPIASRLNDIENLEVIVLALPSVFWGERITVTGLLTGSDVITGLQAHGVAKAAKVWLPDICLAPDGRTFLDDYTVEQVEAATEAKIMVLPADAQGFLEAISRQP